MGSLVGALKRAASGAGISLDEYVARVAAGEKRCTACKEWHLRGAFGADGSRADGLSASCLESRKTGRPRGWHALPAINPETGRPGPAPAPARDGDKVQARQRINVEVRTGRRPHPNALPCVDCGHAWKEGERRHEYDHHMGYEPAHHLDVQSVCTVCHRRRADERNPTFNLTAIFDLALTGEEFPNADVPEVAVVIFRKKTDRPRGLRLLNGLTGAASLALLNGAMDRLGDERLRERFESLQPENGWGDLDGARRVIRELRTLAEEYPTRTWRVH